MNNSRYGVFMISIGGTIAMTSDTTGKGVSPSLNGSDLLGSLATMKGKIHVQVESPYTHPSAHLKFKHLIDLSNRINEITAQNSDAGIVITMGTDTLEEVAYFLNLTYRHSNPVIVTGAMRSPGQIGADGTRNMTDSILCAVSRDCRDLGVLVVMNGEIHGAVDVVKTHTADVSAFKSPVVGALGCVQEERVVMFRRLWKREIVDLEQCDETVELMRCVVGDSGRALKALLELGANGFVVEALGGGHVPPAVRDAIESVVAKQIPVVVTSRCLSGNLLMNTYNYVGSEIDLRSLGVLFANGLNGPKARLKLSVLLGNTSTRNRLAEYFAD